MLHSGIVCVYIYLHISLFSFLHAAVYAFSSLGRKLLQEFKMIVQTKHLTEKAMNESCVHILGGV